jgi:hypothetical protein
MKANFLKFENAPTSAQFQFIIIQLAVNCLPYFYLKKQPSSSQDENVCER